MRRKLTAQNMLSKANTGKRKETCRVFLTSFLLFNVLYMCNENFWIHLPKHMNSIIILQYYSIVVY